MVDDPSACPERFPTEEAQDAERQRLFRIIEQLVLWENTTNEDVLAAARAEIHRSGETPAGTTRITRAPQSCSTPTSSPASTTRSAAVARSRSRRSGSGWKLTPATSTR